LFYTSSRTMFLNSTLKGERCKKETQRILEIAVSLGIILLSLMLSVGQQQTKSIPLHYSYRPQVDKLTYFTQFFWSCYDNIYHHIFNRILLHSLFGIVSSELLLLDHYINQPDRDPEWVELVQQVFIDPLCWDREESPFYVKVKRIQPENSLDRSYFVLVLIGLGLTWFTRYWLSEDLISRLA
uniref:ATP synthase YMF19-like N-terminal domain-containing protein n=1 Tax=Solanum lycopersicum TaxID=4081 RepID=A0A3Q7HBG1_SOLLC